MKNILLDVNVVVDLCVDRSGSANSQLAVALAKSYGLTLWVYAGSVQTLEYVVGSEVRRLTQVPSDKTLSPSVARLKARELLHELTQDCQWLAALSGEGDVFATDDPEDTQLLQALERFSYGEMHLLTRDKLLQEKDHQRTLSPEGLIDFYKQGGVARSTAFVDLAAQQDMIRPALEKNIHTVLHHGKYILGPEVSELEQRLSEYAGCDHAVSCSSGTDALLMALMALEVGPGDAVFTTPFSFIATADVIVRLGATPVFVDIDPRTYNLDSDKLDLAIQAVQQNDPNIYSLPADSTTNRGTDALTPKSVIPVDLYGLPCDYQAIHSLASKHGLQVIQDGAQSFRAEYQGSLCPTLGDIGCASFFPSKPLGSYGDAGALFTKDKDLADRFRSIRVHGQGASKYDTVRLGLKGRMDTLQAAILLPKLDIYAQELEQRRKIAERYKDLLRPLSSDISPPAMPEGHKSAWALYTVLTRGKEQRSALQTELKEQGIPSSIYYGQPLHLQPLFQPLGYHKGDFPVAEDRADRVLSLPMHPYLSFDEQDRICEVIRDKAKNS